MRNSTALFNELVAAEDELHNLKFELDMLERDRVFVNSIALDRSPGGSGAGCASFEKKCDKIVDLKRSIEDKIASLAVRRHEIIALIQRLDDSALSKLLFLRYIKRLTFKEVGLELGYSGSYIYTLHERALAALDKLIAAAETK